MTTLREAAQQALDCLEQLQGGCTDHDDGTVEAITVWCPEIIDALRAALAEPQSFATKEFRLLGAVDVEAADGDYVHLPKGASVWSKPHAAPQPKAEPQEPVAYLYHDARTPKEAHPWLHSTMLVLAADRRPGVRGETPLYTAPQPRKRLTDDEIFTAIHNEVGDLLDHICEYGTEAEGIQRRINAIARAVEAAVWGDGK